MSQNLYTPKQSREFFIALRRSSKEILQHYGIPTDPGRKTRPWKSARPIGVIEHFTAGITWKGAAKWLQTPENPKSSCHFLVLDRKLGEVDAIVSKYPVLDALNTTCIMLADLDEGTFHAGWANSMCVGIENRNAGELRKRNGKFYWWGKSWTAEFNPAVLEKQPVEIDGVWLEPYTKNQIEANIILCQYLHCAYNGGLTPGWFLPHSAVSERKSDTGRAFPIHEVRESIFGQDDVSKLEWLAKFGDDPAYMVDYEDDQESAFLDDVIGMHVGRTDDDSKDGDILESAAIPSIDLQSMVDGGDWKQHMEKIRLGLHQLGYFVGEKPGYTEVLSLAVWQFQKSVGLKPDHIPGTVTREALVKRLKQFNLEK